MKKRVLSALLALCLTLSLAGAAFAENEPSGDSSSAVSQAVSSVESEPQTQDETVSSGSASGEDQTTAKTESTPAPTETPAASDVTEEEPEATEEPEAATEPDATPAPTEDPVADVTENEESDGSVEYTAALETDGETMNVIVTAPEGAFAEDVQPKLSVTMLTAEDELNDVANKLTDAEVQYDGFAALDITFTDKATGEEIEPVQQVSVRIELPQTIVDSGIDLNTLAVQHLEEDENGNVNVAEVATLDNGITLSEEAAAAANEAAGVAHMSDMPAEEATAGDAATETPAAVAEFEVNGFSTFTLTYGYNRTLNIQVVDLNGTTIGQNGSSTISTSWESVQDIADDIVSKNKIPTDKYRFDRAEFRNNRDKTPIKWIKYSEAWFSGGFRYSTSESQPSNYDNGNSVSNGTVYFVFKNNDSGDSGEGSGEQKDSVNWGNLPYPSTEYQNDKTVVNFYLNLYSKIANSSESGGGSAVDKENFTTSVLRTSVSKRPTSFEYTKEYDQDGNFASYVVIQGNTNGSAYEADAEIRNLATSSGTQGFTLADFPTDAEVFNKIRSDWKTYTKGNGIKITQSDGTIKDVKASELTTDNYTIRWYVFKYNLSDAWHVDGILVPKYGRLSVTKTFTFEGSALQSDNELSALVPENYTIAVRSSKNSYTLQMKQSTPTDSLEAPGWNSRNVDLSKGTVTYTWEVDVLDDTYTIQENNYKDVDGYSFSNATYTTTPYNGSESQATAYPEDNGFTIQCATTETDAGDTARQSAALTNTYSKSVGSLEITKVIEGLTDDLAKTQSFTFTITPSQGLTVDWSNVTATDGSNQSLTISETATSAKVTLTGSGTVTISNLPLGSYTVGEETPSNLDDYYYDYNDFDPADKTVEVTADQPGKIKVTNYYGEYKSLTVKKTVAGNMVVDGDTFTFAISGIDKSQIGHDDSIQITDGNNMVNVTMKGNQQVVIEKLKDDDTVTITESDSGDGYTPSIDLSEVAGYTVDSGSASHPGFTTTGTSTVTVVVNQVVSRNSDLGVIEFVNTRNVPVPTGLEDNHTKPFGLMVGVAVMAGLALAGGAVVRRRRRWME